MRLDFVLGLRESQIAAVRKGSGIGFAIAGTAISALVLLPGALFWLSVGSAVSSASKEISDAAASARATNQSTITPSDHEQAGSLKQRPEQQQGRSSESDTASVGAQPKAAPPADVWADASNGVRQGDIEVRVTSARIDSVALTRLGDETSSKDKLLSITLSIKNVSQTKKIQYRGWSGAEGFIARNAATLRDNFDNGYKRIGFGFGTEVVGQISNESIYPGKAVSDVLVFEPPIGAVGFLRLELPAAAFGGTGELRLEIPKGMIEGTTE